MRDITSIGEALIDLTWTGKSPAGVPLYAANPGGAPANLAVAAARLGARTAFLGKVGPDAFGEQLREVLRSNGVDDRGLLTGQTPTTMAVVSVDQEGERSFSFLRGADGELSADEVSEKELEEGKILHFGSVSLTPGKARSATIFAARHAHRSGVLVSFDPNYREKIWQDRSQAAQWISMVLPLVDILKLAQEELPLAVGTEDLEEGTRRLEEAGISLILVTLGAEGVFCRWRGKCVTLPGIPVKVADTNGAGDTFLGAVLARLCRRGEHPLEGLEWKELGEILSFANCAAALTCSRSGAIPAMPTLEEVNQFSQEHLEELL